MNIKIITLLIILLSGETVNAFDERLFSDDINVVKEAINAGADLNAKNNIGETPLMVATLHRLEIAKLLVASKVDLNVIDNYGNTALLLAVLNNCVRAAKLLIDAGADLNVCKIHLEQTALSIAQDYGRKELIELIKEGIEKHKKEVCDIFLDNYEIYKLSPSISELISSYL